MYLKQSKRKDGRTYLSIADGFYDPQKGYTRTINVEKIGYLEDLLKEFDDPVSHFKNVVAQRNAALKAAKKRPTYEYDPDETFDGNNKKNLGYTILSHIYHELALDDFFNSRQRSIKAKFNLNSIMRLLVFSRLLFPASKKKTFEKRDIFFERFDFSLDDLYRSLTHLNKFREALQVWIHEHVVSNYGRDTTISYYDVTNYYFEIDKQDDLRRKGVNKAHTPDPIVQMGLLMDNNGIPVAYQLFPGNQNDCTTLIPIIQRIRREYNVGNTVIVSDKGLNTAKNAYYLANSRGGYVFSQTVRGGSKELKEYVLKNTGYEQFGDDFKKKSRQFTREVEVVDDYGNTIKANIAEKQVIFYSRDYDRRAKADRAPTIAKAKAIVKNPENFNKYNTYGAAKYVKHIEFDTKTGEIIKAGSKMAFDEAKLKEEESYDGYYVIVTNKCDASDEWIINTYRQLWRIEESFKVTKSDLEARPVNVSLAEHIEAHFLTCFVALVIIRLLQKRFDWKYSSEKILDGLSNTCCSNVDANRYVANYNDEIVVEIGNHFGINFRKKNRTLAEIKNIIAASKIR